MSDRDFALTILDLMPLDNNWHVFLSNLRTKVNDFNAQGIPITSASFITSIRDEFWFRHRDDHTNNSEIFSAHFDSQRRSNTPKRPRPADLIATSTAPSPSKRIRTPNPNKAHLVCTNPHCGSKTGHEISDCIAYKGQKEGQYSDWWKGPWNIHLPESMRNKENNIPPKNHPAYTRTTRPSVNQTTTPDSSLNRSTTSPIQSDDNPSQANIATDFYAWNTQVCDTVAQITLPVLNPHLPRDNACHHDSGANRHVFHDRSAFEDYKTISPLTVKGFGHNLSAVAIGKGNIRLEGNYNNQKCSILLRNVLHIPAARMNLISGVQLDKAGVVSTLGHNSIFLSNNNKIIVSGSVINDMYCLDLKIIPPSSVSLASRISPTSLTSRLSPASLASRISPHNTHPVFYTASWGT
jgi:hypothetical protein